MLNNTTWTAETVKNYIQGHFVDTNVSESNIRLGLNFFLSLIGRAKRQALRSGGQKSTTVTVSSTGYDLSTISDIGSLTEGFEVYTNAIKKEYQLPEVKRGETRAGFYLIGTSLFLTEETTGSVIVVYQEKTPRIPEDTALNAYTLPIDQDLEQVCFRYLSSFFYEGEFRPDMAQMNEDKFYAELLQFFAQPTKTRTY